jgi:DNA-binding GntR family transcriptional regulator
VPRLPGVEIDRFSGVPPYRQIAAHLRDRIISGDLPARLPSARDLQAEFGVAAITAVKALRLLREEGYARVSPGMGTYAVPPGERPGGAGEGD